VADDMARDVEIELAELADQLTAPAERECLRCYLLRMTHEFGCDGTHRWTIRWRDMRAAQPGGLLEQLKRRGGLCCDCEVAWNVFPDYPDVTELLPCAGVAKAGSARPCNLRGLRKSA